MDKKLIVGGLAVLGGLALVAYLLKPKSPKQNSDGFFNAVGGGAQDTKPNYAFFALSNGVCTLFVHGVNADGSKAYYKSPSNGSDTYSLASIKGNEYYLATKLPKCK